VLEEFAAPSGLRIARYLLAIDNNIVYGSEISVQAVLAQGIDQYAAYLVVRVRDIEREEPVVDRTNDAVVDLASPIIRERDAAAACASFFRIASFAAIMYLMSTFPKSITRHSFIGITGVNHILPHTLYHRFIL
jgi:hypothetical protein